MACIKVISKHMCKIDIWIKRIKENCDALSGTPGNYNQNLNFFFQVRSYTRRVWSHIHILWYLRNWRVEFHTAELRTYTANHSIPAGWSSLHTLQTILYQLVGPLTYTANHSKPAHWSSLHTLQTILYQLVGPAYIQRKPFHTNWLVH